MGKGYYILKMNRQRMALSLAWSNFQSNFTIGISNTLYPLQPGLTLLTSFKVHTSHGQMEQDPILILPTLQPPPQRSLVQ